MSTKASIGFDRVDDGWNVCEEMLDERVWVSTRGASCDFVAVCGGVEMYLPPAVLDCIADAHAKGWLPHQRAARKKAAAEGGGQ